VAGMSLAEIRASLIYRSEMIYQESLSARTRRKKGADDA